MTSYNINFHGYFESRLKQTLFAGPREFVITEFDCTLLCQILCWIYDTKLNESSWKNMNDGNFFLFKSTNIFWFKPISTFFCQQSLICLLVRNFIWSYYISLSLKNNILKSRIAHRESFCNLNHSFDIYYRLSQ